MVSHFIAICLAYILDLIIGDPVHWPHPVKGMGNYISWCERRLNKGGYKRLKGFLMLLSIILIVVIPSFFLLILAYQLHTAAGILLEAIMIATTIAQKGLKDAALQVNEPLVAGELKNARRKVSYIVGRDTDKLEEPEIVRATVETVAENTSDGITAPLFWAAIGGAPLALAYRAINTCDSMVGYKNEKMKQFGYASARLDDVVNWIPARLTAFLMMITLKPKNSSVKKAFQIFLRDAKRHASPNSGWGEAAVASLLGVQLGGINSYQGVVTTSQTIGEPFVSLNSQHINLAIIIMKRTVLLFIVMLLLGGILYEFASTWF